MVPKVFEPLKFDCMYMIEQENVTLKMAFSVCRYAVIFLSAILMKGNNFQGILFTSLEDEVLLKMVSLIYFIVSEINILTKFR